MTLFPLSDETDFALFWAIYPKRVSKGQARRAFRHALKKIALNPLLEAAGRYARSVKGQDAQFIPYPATWLNGERWLDFPAPVAADPAVRPQTRLDVVAWAVKKRINLGSIAPHEIRLCVQANLITVEEANGFSPGVLR